MRLLENANIVFKESGTGWIQGDANTAQASNDGESTLNTIRSTNPDAWQSKLRLVGTQPSGQAGTTSNHIPRKLFSSSTYNDLREAFNAAVGQKFTLRRHNSNVTYTYNLPFGERINFNDNARHHYSHRSCQENEITDFLCLRQPHSTHNRGCGKNYNKISIGMIDHGKDYFLVDGTCYDTRVKSIRHDFRTIEIKMKKKEGEHFTFSADFIIPGNAGNKEYYARFSLRCRYISVADLRGRVDTESSTQQLQLGIKTISDAVLRERLDIEVLMAEAQIVKNTNSLRCGRFERDKIHCHFEFHGDPLAFSNDGYEYGIKNSDKLDNAINGISVTSYPKSEGHRSKYQRTYPNLLV